ncbi:hypothetical protein NBRC116591_21440 [Sessilibacter corallicola]|uniref:Uncharacterized protein n=1 Tax=Sessilibacter corallicola TaxID=2904075 RepID=A0ABQ0A9J9_9GAMM
MISFRDKIRHENDLVYDIRGEVNGEKRYFILKVASDKHRSFLAILEKGKPYNPLDYGEILYRGWDEPPDELKQELGQKYGMYSEN